jgi:hypothetical protein
VSYPNPDAAIAYVTEIDEVYPFEPTTDTLVLPSKHDPVWDRLGDSRFTGREWRIRENATHAKSKTYQRPPISTNIQKIRYS